MDVCGGGGGGGWEKRAVASELARMLDMVREALLGQDLPVATRKILGDLASSAERSVRIVESCGWAELYYSPGSGDGSPPHTEAAQDRAAAAGKLKAQSSNGRNRRPCVRRQVRLASVQDMAAALDDGHSWRKYGQKDILGAKYPRAYFRCTHRHSQGCLATKHVQRADGDPLLFDVVYNGAHACAEFARPTAEQLRQQVQPEGGHAGMEKSSPPLAPESEGLQAGLEPMAPCSFASAPGAGADLAGCCPLLPQTGSEWQLRSDDAAGGLGVGMDYELQIEEFFQDATDSFDWDLQAAN